MPTSIPQTGDRLRLEAVFLGQEILLMLESCRQGRRETREPFDPRPKPGSNADRPFPLAYMLGGKVPMITWVMPRETCPKGYYFSSKEGRCVKKKKKGDL